MPGRTIRPCLWITGSFSSAAYPSPFIYAACCEWICERNAAQLTRSHTRQRDRLDGRCPATCTFETRETPGNRDWLAHSPAVAASRPHDLRAKDFVALCRLASAPAMVTRLCPLRKRRNRALGSQPTAAHRLFIEYGETQRDRTRMVQPPPKSNLLLRGINRERSSTSKKVEVQKPVSQVRILPGAQAP